MTWTALRRGNEAEGDWFHDGCLCAACNPEIAGKS
jgi:hypothetical protein